MATVTPNFNWPVPTSTDLVKDGATAIEALGDSIDASLVDLKGGTTGQVLSKTTNTDMDFTWVSATAGDIEGVTAGVGISGGGTSGTVTVTNSMATAIDAKGDLVPGTGADTFARLPVGANNTVLTADSSTATGLKWATPAGGGKILQVVQGTTTTTVTIASTTLTDTGITATITPTSTTSKILIMIASSSVQYRGSDSSYAGAKLLRGATNISDWFTGQWSGIAVTGGNTEVTLKHNQSIVYLDSPATTSATTYKLQSAVSSTANSGNIEFQSGNAPSVIILMEVGA